MAITHSFVSAVSDSPGADKVGKDRWNAAHTIGNDTITSAMIASGQITSAKIADGTIVNADINASAAIALTKIDAASKLDGSHVKNGTADYANGIIPVMYVFTFPAGHGTTQQVTVTNKVRVADGWYWKSGSDGSGQIIVADDGDNFMWFIISSEYGGGGASGTKTNPFFLEGGYRDISAGAVLSATSTHTGEAGEDVQGNLYLLCYRLA